jgi:hypothetical protein
LHHAVLTSAQDGSERSASCPSRFIPEKDPAVRVVLVCRAGWAQERIWTLQLWTRGSSKNCLLECDAVYSGRLFQNVLEKPFASTFRIKIYGLLGNWHYIPEDIDLHSYPPVRASNLAQKHLCTCREPNPGCPDHSLA